MIGRQEQLSLTTYLSQSKKVSARREWSSVLVAVVLIIGSVGIVLDLSLHVDSYQRDLQTYYFAGKAYAVGRNPYDINVLSELAQSPVQHRFVYPPATLPLFRLLASMDFTTAYYFFLAIKGIVLIGLFYLWKKAFLPEMDAPFFLFSLVAYNAAIYVDLRVGNISIFEQILIWLAFLSYSRNQPLLFSFLLLFAASFKVVPILFLSLLLLSKNERKYMYLLGSVVFFLVFQIFSYYARPFLFQDFLGSLGGLDERGVINPSTLALVRDVFDLVAENTGMVVPKVVQLVLFISLAVGVSLVSWRAYRVLGNVKTLPEKERMGIFLFCLAYALVLPRFKTYSYILLLVPTYFVLMRFDRGDTGASLGRHVKRYGPLIALTAFSSLHVVSLGSDATMKSLLSYSSLIAAYCVWGLYLYQIFVLAGKPGSVPVAVSS